MDQPSQRQSILNLCLSGIIAMIFAATIASAVESNPSSATSPHFPMLSQDEAWNRLPVPLKGAGQPLPTWARILVGELPKTTAALLELELAHRKANPIEPRLRAAMQWVSANAIRCEYAKQSAAADATKAGVDQAKLAALQQSGFPGWSDHERLALEFALKMTEDSDSVTDAEFAALVAGFGEKQAASMVLMMAFTNFHDRLLICLGAPLEPDGALPPVDVKFSWDSFVTKTTPPPARKLLSLPDPTGSDLIDDEPEWKSVSYDSLQKRLESQRQKPTRLPIPSWDQLRSNLPEGLMKKPSDIIWYRIVFGYAPELAVPFEIVMRTAGAEASSKWDRVFGQSLFWVTTRAVKCPYCMSHCEMNWEVAGLTRSEIADRSRLLAGDDWSSFKPEEQFAFAFARKLTRTPWKISRSDADQLINSWNGDRAMIVMLNASRYHYMTRISNGFQLTLERENVFYDYYNVKAPAVATVPDSTSTAVPLLSNEEAWSRLPATTSGANQQLPNWAKAVASELPRTAAAMLQLDYVHRTKSPLDPVLRAKMRWAIAQANHCEYSATYALKDLERLGVDAAARTALTGDPAAWSMADREPLEFARLLTVAAPTIRDELFESLRTKYGDKCVAAMVLLAAYGNFQDRIVLGLNLAIEEGGPLPPLEITFAINAFQMAPIFPPHAQPSRLLDGGTTVVKSDQDWAALSYGDLQSRLEKQRDRRPRLPIPAWDDVKQNLPATMTAKPTRIIWNLVCSGYVPELAVPWSIATRTMWSETKPDRVFEESLFWIQTRSIECNYCMGHCEMLLEVAGLNKQEIAERTSRLASTDWSAFPATEQRAFDYARKLSRTPWKLTPQDYRQLETDYGPKVAMATFWWLCRGLYMTRVSDGFQLPLERENVFGDPNKLPSVDRPTAALKTP